MANKPKVCVIGAGPAGIMAISILKKHCDVECYERANDIGGQWGVNTDEFCKKHYGTRESSLYKGFWTNAPKEAGFEVPNYPWTETLASYVQIDDLRKYLFGYADAFGVRDYVKTAHSVESVIYKNDKFSIIVKDMETGITSTQSYDYVCVATGHFHYPNNPTFDGEQTFPGEILHAHDFIDGADYAGKRVLCIGGAYSAEDICMLCNKNGATYSHVTTRAAAGFGYVDWPANVIEKPILTNISGSTVTFKDGKTEDYDVIIKCTGYIHKFDFLPADLQINAVGNAFVPNGLYKQCISIENPKLFFLGMQHLAYTLPMFQLQDKEARQAGFEADLAVQATFTSILSPVYFQTNYLNELSELTNEAKVDTDKIWIAMIDHKLESIQKYRTNNYASIHTGKIGTSIFKIEEK